MNQHNQTLTDDSASNLPHQIITNRVIRQLLEALLFEKICEYSFQQGLFTFSLGQHQYCLAGKISGFSRVRLNAQQMLFAPLSQNHDPQWQAVGLLELVEDLPTTTDVKQRLLGELQQTIKLCLYNDQYLPRVNDRRQLNYHQLESAIDEGHPYHPCFKARTGFTEQDHKIYGPEFGNTFRLDWLAIRRCYLKRRFDLGSEQAFWIKELGTETYDFLLQEVAKQTNDGAAFSLMPIHPWQWHNLKDKLQQAIVEKQVIYLGSAGDLYQAGISVRTLFNISHPKKANIKLPLNMVNTSSLRSIESHSFCTAPVLSKWLVALTEQDSYLQQKMVLLPEYAGIRPENDTEQTQQWISELDGHLGAIYRESLANYCPENKVIPFVALTLIEQDNAPFIEPWIRQHGCEKWLKQLVETAILPIWHLLVHHGIGIEAHGQNMLLQHEQGWPCKVIVRDFHESLEYVHDYLAQPEIAPIFSEFEAEYATAKPDQYYWMSDVEALRELIIDTLFVFNLADLEVLLEDYYQFAEADFWRIIDQCFADYQASGLTSEQRLNQMDIYQAEIKTESLLKKKFDGRRAAEYHHLVHNPIGTTPHRLSKQLDKTPQQETKQVIHDGEAHA
ncbi:hypothetical protein C2869_06595 [Saccharobesus litoralis]|uniref:Siderophore biosynthesis protein n=1 Tax=Saccharobesus litoralis TaxID=2172099 RepID=A0A2S0VPK5_9ALTE|nr:IucA/IucC family protein [Saccharobesus litoralis]AWB66129.1 hypothetical protein C2869_06595 [Saccharobesus litoralis]